MFSKVIIDGEATIEKVKYRGNRWKGGDAIIREVVERK